MEKFAGGWIRRDGRASSDLLETDFVLQQLQVLLQLQVVFLKEAIKRLLHVSELGQQPETNTARGKIRISNQTYKP